MAFNAKNLNDYLALIRRRKFYILIAWGLVTLLSVVIAYNLPKTYRSTATMLMQAPLPAKFSDTSGHIYADEQIQTIYQRAFTKENVLSIIDKFKLYPNAKNSDTRDDDLVAEFKGSTEVNLATSTLGNNSNVADIIFNISFSYEQAVQAKEVVAELANILIQLHDNARTRRAVSVTGFLVEELEKLSQKNQEIENRITKFKEEHILSLPEQQHENVSSIERTENDLRDTESQIRSTKDKIIFLEAELARAQAEAPVVQNNNIPTNKEDALRLLQAKYAQLSSIYSPSHPDIIRIKREIKALNASADLSPSKEDIIERLAESKRELKLLEESYTGNHPELIKHRVEIEKLEEQLKKAKSEYNPDSPRDILRRTSNPAYFGLEVQYKNSKSELQSLIQKQEYLKTKLENTKNILSISPKVEAEYTDMIRERDSTLKKYNQLKEKWLDANLVQAMEEQQQGQTLIILEPANVPTHPEKAIRKKVAIGGFVFGAIVGAGLAFLAELLDPTVRGYRSVAEVTGLDPLIVIPYIESLSEENYKSARQKQMKKLRAWILAGSIFLVVITAVVFFLYFWSA